MVKSLHLRIILWWRMTWEYNALISTLGSWGYVESCTLVCHHKGEVIPSLAHNFSSEARPLLIFYWSKRWFSNEWEGGFICLMVWFYLGSLWFTVSMGGFRVITKGNHCVRVIYSLPSLNVVINFNPFEHLILTHLHLMPKPTTSTNPKANKKHLMFKFWCHMSWVCWFIS